MNATKELNLRFRNKICGAFVVAALSVVSSVTLASNECKIKYQYKNSQGGKLTRYLNLNSGQIKSIGAAHLNYVKNLKNREVNIWVDSYNKRLKKNNVDPFGGIHLKDVVFHKVKCLAGNAPTAIDIVVRNLKRAGKTSSQIASHLKNILNQNAGQTARWLKGVGYTAGQVAKALKITFNYNVNQVARILKSVFNLGDQAIASALKSAGYAMNQVASAIKSTLGATASEAARILKNVYRGTNSAIASSLKSAGYAINQVASALKSSLGATATEAARILKTLYRGTKSAVTSALKSAGYAINQVASALKTVWNANATEVAKLLKPVYRASKSAVARALKVAGYSASQIAAALRDVFKLSAASIVNVLKSIGYSANQAAKAVETFAGNTPRQNRAAVGRAINTSATRMTNQLALKLYDSYFKVVAHKARMKPLSRRLQKALKNAGIKNPNLIRVGYSPFLAVSNVGMTNCNSIYFPHRKFVAAFTRGKNIKNNNLKFLLHEIKHTLQCRPSRTRFAASWFKQLPKAVVTSVQRGKPNSKAIHNAMPLESQAESFMNSKFRAVQANY